MNFHQTPEQIINNATAEQRILWNSIFLTFGENLGLQQISYAGLIAGSEFLIYSANKMYFLLKLTAFCGGLLAAVPSVTIWNDANASIGIMTNASAFWNATTAVPNYVGNNLNIENVLISRISNSLYTNISVIGYRLSI